MSNDIVCKSVNIEVTRDCWKKLKMIGIQREVTIVHVLSDILEKSVSKQKFDKPEV